MTDIEIIGAVPSLGNGLQLLVPEILCHPNVPKPLHGVAPRVIMGDGWWNRIRGLVYQKYDYRCAACGVPKHLARRFQHLEAHEFYEVDYNTGIVIVKSLEPLCNYCHMFIHNGRLVNTLNTPQGASTRIAMEILRHGFNVCIENDIACFHGAVDAAEYLEMPVPYDLKYYTPEVNPDIEWGDWKMIFQGREYYSKFKSMDEWAQFYKS